MDRRSHSRGPLAGHWRAQLQLQCFTARWSGGRGTDRVIEEASWNMLPFRTAPVCASKLGNCGIERKARAVASFGDPSAALSSTPSVVCGSARKAADPCFFPSAMLQWPADFSGWPVQSGCFIGRGASELTSIIVSRIYSDDDRREGPPSCGSVLFPHAPGVTVGYGARRTLWCKSLVLKLACGQKRDR